MMEQSNSITDRENWWHIVSWYHMPYGKVPKGMWIGYPENPDDKLYWENPPPPEDPAKILNWGKPIDEQVWTRRPDPPFWSASYIRKMAIDKFSTGNTPKDRIKNADYYFYMNPMNLTDEQWLHQDTEWEFRMNGTYITIGGEFIYLTGKYYTYLQHWYLEDCYPDFRDRDLLTWYAWQNICDDPLCSGGIFPKHRRAADTSKWAYEGVEETTRTKSGHFGIQAAGKTGAKKVFTDKVVKGWKRWPLYFKPVTSSGDNPKSEIIMDAESRKGRSQHTVVSAADEEVLEGWIKYEGNGNTGDAPFDGDKMVRYFRDEGGKETLTDILDTWELVKPCLVNRSGRGKAAWPSTVEDVAGKYKGAFEKLCMDSMPSQIKYTGTGETRSGLKFFFLPCYIGHSEWWFTGKFGESIIHKPTPEQREWLLERWGTTAAKRKVLEEIYDQGGAYEYELRMRAANKGNVAYKRKFPFNIGEVFAPSNPDCFYNLDHLNALRGSLTTPTAHDTTLFKELTIRGRLEWVDKIVKGDVVFIEDSRGPFLFNKSYLPGGERAKLLGIAGNNCNRDSHGRVWPSTASRIKIGFDPQKQDSDESTGHKSGLSKAAAHGFYPYDPSVEKYPWDEANPEFSKNYITHACIFEYFILPKDSTTTHEDMLKACIYLNARFHSEKQVFTAISYFKKMNANGFLFRDIELNGINRESRQVVAGQAANEMTEIMANDRIKDFVEYHAYPDRFPFPATIDQLIRYNRKNVSQLDLKVSFGFTLMAVQPGAVADHKTKQARKENKEKPKTVAEAVTGAGLYTLSKGYTT